REGGQNQGAGVTSCFNRLRMSRRLLPIGIQSFRTIREQDFHYVDKTPLIRRLVDEGRNYFLSRPRRFGKSLLLDTIRSLFECNEELFRGLDIHGHWDWSAPHPVVRLSFDGKYNEPRDLELSILTQLDVIERNAGLSRTSCRTGPERLLDLLDRLHHATGRQVAVLVDEYDKPILDVPHDPELATANRDYLHGFYGIIKGSAEHVRFTFVTGVSMFSKASLFSGLNNLRDISLDPRYATVCGYTEDDLNRVFGPELDGLDREEVRTWYKGYHWRGGERVYNPCDVLLLLRNREFRPYWFETGSPTFLFRMLMERSVGPMELENRMADMSLVSKFDVNDIGIEALLFQTGYLTIAEERKEGFRTYCRLDYPNLEVRVSLNDELLAYLGKKGKEPLDQGRAFCALLEANDFEGFAERLRSYLSGIPYQWHATGDLARYEAWYASLLHMCFRAIGVEVHAEDASSHGRADMVVLTGGQVFVLEFKMADGEGDADAALDAALAQMRERGYADKCRGQGAPVHLLAVACGREARNLLEIRAEAA
ncbi:MAG: AAA family ATPase, partial [Boseongicola sp.]|nr:AAA family ATPase [Boseongicola sp.]